MSIIEKNSLVHCLPFQATLAPIFCPLASYIPFFLHSNMASLNLMPICRILKGFFQFEISINGLVSSSRFIRILMLWVYIHYKYFFFRCGDNLYTSESDTYRRLKTVPGLKGLKSICRFKYFQI